MEEKNYLFSAPTLILLSIGVIALLGFALLAIEGGRVHMERSQAQSIANDAASAMCSGGHDLTNYENEIDSSGLNSISVHHPPTSGLYAGNPDYVEVVVSRAVRGGLSDLVYSDPVAVTGQAIVLCNNQSTTVSWAD